MHMHKHTEDKLQYKHNTTSSTVPVTKEQLFSSRDMSATRTNDADAAAAAAVLPMHRSCSATQNPPPSRSPWTAVVVDEGTESEAPMTTIQAVTSATSTTTTTLTTTTTDVTRRMMCGGLAGMVAKTVTNPLERIKMLSQTGEHVVVAAAMKATTTTNNNHHHSSIMGIYRSILQHEGWFGLWAGNGANLLRVVPSKAVIFSSNDIYQNLLHRYFAPDHDVHHPPHHHPAIPSLSAPYTFLAGGLAGMTATAATYPLDLARGRIAGKLATTTPTATIAAAAPTSYTPKVYVGILQTLAVTVQDEGIWALYKGVTPTLLGAMPYVGIQFGTVGVLEKVFPVATATTATTADSDNTTTTTNRALRKMVFGGVGGVAAGLVTYPNDTVRRLLQLQGSRGTVAQYRGYWDCVRQTVHQNGVARLYRGLTVNLLRMAPNTAVSFGTYELLQQLTEQWSF